MSVKIDFDIREQIYIKYLELEIYWIKSSLNYNLR